MTERWPVESFVLGAATGRGIPLLRGQILTIAQVGDGQCLDLNVYNLHDYREHFHSGRTRGLNGVNPTTGAHLWSAPPRERPMLTIIEDTVGRNDVTYSRCSAFLYEFHYGFDGAVAHSNCHDAFAEAIREWGLTPDDVHDSFNGFMNTRISNGRLTIDRMLARQGDRLSFLAQMDALAVPVCCGGDLGATNNYELKGLEVSVWDGSEAEQARLVGETFVHQRRVSDFRNQAIRTKRALARDPDYRPEWPWRHAVVTSSATEVCLESEARAHLESIRSSGRFDDFTDEVLIRFVLFQWLEARHRRLCL